ncbi:hypothetical protein D6D13_02458 [Aureobasidium pullulans]|uniref:Spindle pole body component n=1 Tax=Aureobasidium pullulans TaxID=5580 RepID=A0A4V4J220_AURPU|nr:hypothetical protein D6D13_02458 [Aureobasidium pullulans]
MGDVNLGKSSKKESVGCFARASGHGVNSFHVWVRGSYKFMTTSTPRPKAVINGMDGDYGPFHVPDFWCKSVYSLPDASGQTLFSDTHFGMLDTLHHQKRPTKTTTELPLIDSHFDVELRLPDIDTFQFGKLDDLSLPEEPEQEASISHHKPSEPSLSGEIEALWKLDLNTPDNVSLRTWEAFANAHHVESRVSCISEAGPRAFDALQSHDTDVLQSAFTLKCLALLGLGRSSALFQWKKEEKTFIPTLANVRLSGLSRTAFDSIIDRLSTTGSDFAELRQFVQSSYANKHPLAARVALATSVQAVVEALDQNLSECVLQAPSTLQLLAYFDGPAMLLAEMRNLVDATSHAKTDTIFLSACHEAICQKTGLTRERLDLPDQDDILESSAHISSQDSAQIHEVMTGTAILAVSAPSHPLLHSASWGIEQPDLETSMMNTDIDRITKKADKYQQDLLAAISRYESGDSKPHGVETKEDFDNLTSEQLPWSLDQAQQTYFEGVGTQFTQYPLNQADASGLQLLVANVLKDVDGNQDVSQLDLRIPTTTTLRRIQPYLNVQARLLNGTLLRLLFRQFSLRNHLTLNHSFHLLGNGLFVQHLTTALFTSETNTHGLRLDNRSKQWPPASSELRLGLMGVLSEAYGSNDIPGNLSFAVRELGDEEIEKCLDADSIHALDFLRLRYEAPAPLDVILDDAAMSKYDDCFRVLLGVLRMLHFVTLLRTTAQQKDSSAAAQAFAHEAWSCVSSLASYFFDIGITGPWQDFQKTLDGIEADLMTEDQEDCYGERVRISVSGLRDKHNDMLDTIRSRLFLRSRHNKLRSAVEDIFGFILGVQHTDLTINESLLWQQKNTLREKIAGLRDTLHELTRKVGKKKDLASQDRDDVFAAEVLGFRLGDE